MWPNSLVNEIKSMMSSNKRIRYRAVSLDKVGYERLKRFRSFRTIRQEIMGGLVSHARTSQPNPFTI
jgi:hypothetical protein